MEGKRQNRIQEAAIPEKGTIRRIVEVLEETSLPTWTSCRARPRKEKPPTISDDLSIRTADITATSYLAAYAELEDELASIERRKIGRPLRISWGSHSQPLPECWATFCSISGSTPLSIQLPLP
ncbi:uncharacterized protein [Drosophila suzukii]|uniref:Uncharacterized protein isoform X2 n=1 Tax=Drosophila suzukii TaxID=28584 RepID=A0ABM4TX41_DROSZ|nr:uncharacterized protein LOC118878501 isoform X2 [Drosophila suzukii]